MSGAEGRARAPAVARLAIDGGEPVRREFLPYAHQSIDDHDIAAVTAALRSDWLTTGPRVPAFEQDLAAFTGARHAVAFSSGTAALHGATAAAGLGPGDEAITTPMTFVATANAVVYVGAEPRFADIDPGTLLIRPDAVAAAITPRTKALLPVDYAGQPADYGALRTVADRAPGGPLTIIADASHSLGATWGGRSVGTLADMTVLSLHPAKILTTGEGGAVLTDNDDYAERLRRFRNHGIATELAARRDWTYQMVDLGYNYRLTDIQSALGLSQLPKLASRIVRRQSIADEYARAFAAIPEVWSLVLRPGVSHAYHLYVVRVDMARLICDRATFFGAMRREGIGVNVHYIPVHLHPFYRQRFGLGPGLCPVAEAAYEQLITLPMFAAMTPRDVRDVIEAVRKVVGAFRSDQPGGRPPRGDR